MSDRGFATAIDSLFERLGVDAIYRDKQGKTTAIKAIPRRPEQLFELGEQHLHAEKPQIDIRVSEVRRPHRGDIIELADTGYRIEAEPRKELHQLVWVIDTLPLDVAVHGVATHGVATNEIATHEVAIHGTSRC